MTTEQNDTSSTRSLRTAPKTTLEKSVIVKGIYQLKPDQFFSVVGETTARGNPLKLFKPNKNIIKCNTLSSTAINDCNTLSTDTVLAPTLNIFKSRLEDE